MTEEQLKWRFPDNWTIIQSDGRQVRIEVSQDGNTLVGTAHAAQGNLSVEMTGAVSGSVVGDTINLTIYWPDKTIAEFNGTVSGEGKAAGTTSDRSDASSVEWSVEQTLAAWG